MDVVMILKAALIAVVCGVTEFLPVSSNGHVIIIGEVLDFKGPSGKLFEISLQLGAILAVCWLYRGKLWSTASGIVSRKKDQRFALNVILACVPATVIGFLFHHYIIEHLFNPFVVAIMLVLGGVAILAVEQWKPAAQVTSIDAISLKRALLIGLFQALAMLPGMSRSAATIMGGMLLGLTRQAATEFSFFLAIPMIFMAAFYDLFLHRTELTTDSLTVIAVGFVVAFFSAMLVVQWLMGFISRHDFRPFAIYRIIAGTLVLVLLALR